MYKKLSLLLIGMIFVVGAFAIEGYINQAQLDNLDVETLNAQTLQCQILGVAPFIYYENGMLLTYFKCLEVEKIEDDVYFFHDNGIYHTTVSYEEMLNLSQETNLSHAVDVYWQIARHQGQNHIEGIKSNIWNYQTHDFNDDGWDGDLW